MREKLKKLYGTNARTAADRAEYSERTEHTKSSRYTLESYFKQQRTSASAFFQLRVLQWC